MQGHLLGAATVRRRFGKSNRQENDCCREALPCKFRLEFDLPLRSGPKGQPIISVFPLLVKKNVRPGGCPRPITSDHQIGQLPHHPGTIFLYRDLVLYSEPYPRFGDLSHRNAVSLPGIEPGSRQPKSGILTTRPQRTSGQLYAWE